MLLRLECPQRASGVFAVMLSARVQDGSTAGHGQGPGSMGYAIILNDAESVPCNVSGRVDT